MKRVLIVDDDEAILEAISIVLESEGYSVRTVIDAEGAIPAVKEYQPDIIFLDLLLSGKEGTKIVDEIKDNNQYSTIPVILISAHPNAKTSASECGADEFLAKPFDLSELLSLVQKYTS